MLEENEEITGQDIKESETESGIDIDEIDYHCTGYLIHWQQPRTEFAGLSYGTIAVLNYQLWTMT